MHIQQALAIKTEIENHTGPTICEGGTMSAEDARQLEWLKVELQKFADKWGLESFGLSISTVAEKTLKRLRKTYCPKPQ